MSSNGQGEKPAAPGDRGCKEATLRAHELATASSHAVRAALLHPDAPATVTAWLVDVVTSAEALMSAIEREQAELKGDPQDRCDSCDINIVPAGTGRCPRCLGDLRRIEA